MYDKSYEPIRILNDCGGMLYKRDFYKLIQGKTHKAEYLQKFIDNHFLFEFKIIEEEIQYIKSYVSVVSITTDEEYQRILAHNLGLEKLNSNPLAQKANKIRESILPSFYAQLNSASAKLMYHFANIRSMKYEKPSLEYLQYRLTNENNDGLINNSKNKKQKLKEGYIDYLIELACVEEKEVEDKNGNKQIIKLINKNKANELCRQYINAGLYYDKEEFKQYAKSIHGVSANDSYKNVKFEGIFFNNHSCLVTTVYASSDSSRLKIYKSSLMNLKERINELIIDKLKLTVNRQILGFDNIFNDEKSVAPYKHGINALLITISNTMVPTMAVGAKGGMFKERGHKYVSLHTDEKFKSELLDFTNTSYGLIFPVVKSDDGIRHLRYITSHSIESWRAESSLMLSLNNTDGRFTNITIPTGEDTVSFYPGNDSITGYKCIFMPVYEVKLLARLYEKGTRGKQDLLIFTEKDMCNFISHSVRLGNKDISKLMFNEIKSKDYIESKKKVANVNKEGKTTRLNKSPEIVYSIPNLELVAKDESALLESNIPFHKKAFMSVKDTSYEIFDTIDKTEYYIYNDLGKVSGKEIFEDWVSANKNQKVLYKNAKKSELITFFNSIYEETLDCEEAYSRSSEYGIFFEKQDEKVVKERDNAVTIRFKTSELNHLKQLAEKKRMTVPAYIKSFILNKIDDK